MLNKVNSLAKHKLKDESIYESFPRSKKSILEVLFLKSIQVGMREISLDDDKIKSLTTYDTSGLYTDPSYQHNHNQGLKNIRTSWIKKIEMGFWNALKKN